MRFIALIAILFLTDPSFAQFTTTMTIERSENVGDEFEVYVSLPPDYNKESTYSIVYYLDANLNSGKELRALISSGELRVGLNKYIFVGIGHIGDYHSLRRRDFILPQFVGSDTVPKNKDIGHIREFYQYLKEELIPAIHSRFHTQADNSSIIGHSLGGLFVFYCLFMNEDLFAKYFALSPSLWIDNRSIYLFNRIRDGFQAPKLLYFAAGSKETSNHILRGTEDAKEFFDKEAYKGLEYRYEVHAKQSHNSMVAVSLARIINEIL